MEKHFPIEFAERVAIERTLKTRERVTHHEHVDASDGAFTHNPSEQLVGRWRRVTSAEREIIFVATKRSVTLQLMHDQESPRAARILCAVRHVLCDLREARLHIAIGDEVRLDAAISGKALEHPVLRSICRCSIENVNRRVGRLEMDRKQERCSRRERLIVARTNRCDIRARCTCEPRTCWILDRHGFARPNAHIAARIWLQVLACARMERHRCARISFENDARKLIEAALCAALAFTEPNIALLIGQERDLERRVALDPTAGIVVDRFARS